MNTLISLPTRFSLLTVLLLAPAAEARYAVDWSTMDGGGGRASGGSYVLTGTIGQPDAGVSSGGAYVLQGGFWSAFSEPTEPAPSLRVALDGSNVLLAWPNPSTGYQLQETPSLSSPNWTDVKGDPAIVGNEKHVSQPVRPGPRFYRLWRP